MGTTLFLSGDSIFGLRRYFLLDPSVIFLKHGSFGATTRLVFAADQRLYYSFIGGDGGQLVRSMELSGGKIADVLALGRDSASLALSRDGKWLVYLDKLLGRMALGVYVARLDGAGAAWSSSLTVDGG